MGLPPVRIEVLNKIDGVEFSECFSRSKSVEIDGVPVNLISLADLRQNKLASCSFALHKTPFDFTPYDDGEIVL